MKTKEGKKQVLGFGCQVSGKTRLGTGDWGLVVARLKIQDSRRPAETPYDGISPEVYEKNVVDCSKSGVRPADCPGFADTEIKRSRSDLDSTILSPVS